MGELRGMNAPVDMGVEEVRKLLAEREPGGCNLVDVRQDWEYAEAHAPGALSLPLAELADRMGELDGKKPTVVYCRSGRRSAAGASLLAGQGFSPVYNMLGGMTAWSGETAVGPVEAGMLRFRGDETPLEVLRMAYGMETALGAFYTDMAGKTAEKEIAETFTRLAGFEDRHRNMVLALYRKLDDAGARREDLEKDADFGELEGGLTGRDYLGTIGGAPEGPAEVLELAMNIEAQALDLYMRFAARIGSGESEAVLVKLAAEEKRHLKALAALMDRASFGR